MKRGQILTYDAIGGVVIFLIAVGILLTYWSSSTASYTRDSTLITQAEIVLDNVLDSEFFESHLYLTKFEDEDEFCALLNGNRTSLGLYNYYNLTVYDKNGVQLLSCADWKELNDVVVSQRIVFYNGETSKVVLKISG